MSCLFYTRCYQFSKTTILYIDLPLLHHIEINYLSFILFNWLYIANFYQSSEMITNLHQPNYIRFEKIEFN